MFSGAGLLPNRLQRTMIVLVFHCMEYGNSWIGFTILGIVTSHVYTGILVENSTFFIRKNYINGLLKCDCRFLSDIVSTDAVDHALFFFPLKFHKK